MVAEPDDTFADQLEAWLRAPGPKTLGSLREVFAEKSFAVTILLLMFVPALPLPTGGITHVFEGIAVVVAAQMVVGRPTLWLPERWTRRELGPLTTDKGIPFLLRWVRRFERFSRPRGVWFFHRRWSAPILGLLLIGLATTAALAPPFSGLDTIPALGAVAITLSIILEDVVVLAIGVLIGTGGAVIIVTIGAAVVRALRDLL
ncbi:MAG: exopolysaccharide biosynthesis protein [Acidimicrobiales bacterium]